jgi:hypothetical protein
LYNTLVIEAPPRRAARESSQSIRRRSPLAPDFFFFSLNSRQAD